MLDVLLLMWATDIVTGVKVVASIVTFLSFGIGFIAMMSAIDRDEVKVIVRTVLMFLIPAMLIFLVAPSKTTMQATVVVVAGGKLADVDAVQRIGNKAVTALESILDEYTVEEPVN